MLPRDLELRELSRGDLDAVIELISRCDHSYLEWAPAGWRPPEPGWYRERWEERLPHREMWARGAHVNAVFVDPAHWRRGVGRSLLAMAEEEMRARGHHFARLWTPEGAPACRFYERLGWRPERR